MIETSCLFVALVCSSGQGVHVFIHLHNTYLSLKLKAHLSANFGFNKSLNLKGIYTEGEITQGSNREKVINQIIYILILYVTHVNIHSFFFVQFSLFSLLNEV